MSTADTEARPLTYAAGRALQEPNGDPAIHDPATGDCVIDDWRFMEDWQRQASPSLGAMLRAGQIRRANPLLVAAIEAGASRRS